MLYKFNKILGHTIKIERIYVFCIYFPLYLTFHHQFVLRVTELNITFQKMYTFKGVTILLYKLWLLKGVKNTQKPLSTSKLFLKKHGYFAKYMSCNYGFPFMFLGKHISKPQKAKHAQDCNNDYSIAI